MFMEKPSNLSQKKIFDLRRETRFGDVNLLTFVTVQVYFCLDICLAQPDCDAGHTRCPTGGGQCCISDTKLCDRYVDCVGGRDEKNCPTPPPRYGQ